MADRILKVKCTNTECGQLLNVKVSESAQAVKVYCPKCNKLLQIKISLPQMNTNNKITAKKITLTCPNDKHKFAITCPEKPGGYMAQCPKCGKKYKVSISQELLDKLSGGDKVTSSDANQPRNETKLVGATKPMSLGGKLVLLRKLWKNKEFILPIGSTIIGRKDSESPSDFSIENDSSVSRRSVKIDVELTPDGYIFKLELLKSTNQVLLNNKVVAPGLVYLLSFGDCLILGKTKIRFDKVK